MPERKLRSALKELGKENCPNCKREIGLIDAAWNEASTEYGTEYSVMQITCQACDTEVWHKETWAAIESIEDFIEELHE